MWSSKLSKSLRAAGYEVEIADSVPAASDAMIAVINLSDQNIVEVEALKKQGIKTLAHAGHKEKELLSLGTQLGCDRVVSNSEITHKLPVIVKEMIDEGQLRKND